MPIVRSKQGCFTCRSRRKKCDEQRPKCTACSRNFLTCEWPTYPNQTLLQFKHAQKITSNGGSSSSKSSESVPDSYAWMLTAFLGQTPEDDMALLEALMGPFFLSLIPEQTRAKAKEQFLLQQRTSVPLKKIAECIGALLMSKDEECQEQLYEETLRTLSEEFGSATNDTVEDWALNTINLLTLREFSLENPRVSELVKHMQASFHVIATRICHNQILFWLRLAADSYTFYSGMLILCSDPDGIAKITNPIEVEKIWELLYSDADGHNYDTNPILSELYGSFNLTNQASFLLRSTKPHCDKLGTVLLRKVERLAMRAASPLLLVMYCCCQIILLKTLKPDISNLEKLVVLVNEQLIGDLTRVPTAEMSLFGILPIVICAACSVKQAHRATIMRLCSENNWGAPTELNLKFSLALQSIWQNDTGISALSDTGLLGKLLLNA